MQVNTYENRQSDRQTDKTAGETNKHLYVWSVNELNYTDKPQKASKGFIINAANTREIMRNNQITRLSYKSDIYNTHRDIYNIYDN